MYNMYKFKLSKFTILQAKLTSRYLDLIKDLYTEPSEDIAVGNLFNFVMTLSPTVTPQAPGKRKKKSTSTSTSTVIIGTSEKCSQLQKRKKHHVLL